MTGGATLNREGQVNILLNVPNPLRNAALGDRHAAGQPSPDAPRRERDLVVDDSLSVHTVQEQLLRNLGCDVAVGADRVNAFEQMRLGEFELVRADLEMRPLRGYELISELHGTDIRNGAANRSP